IRSASQVNQAYNVNIQTTLPNNLSINSQNNSSTNPLQVGNSNSQNSTQNVRINNPSGPSVFPSNNQPSNNTLNVGNNRNDNLLTVNSTASNNQTATKTNQSQANVLVVPVNQPNNQAINNPNNLQVTSSVNTGNLQTTKTTLTNSPSQVNSQPSNTVALNPPINQATRGLNNQLNRQISPDSTKDDSSESAPAAVNITESNQPITPGELYVMNQELTSLLGRFHNSLIASQSAHFADGLTASNDPDNLVASSDRTTTFIANKSIPSTEKADQAIAQARQTLNELPNLVRSHQYATARQQWLTARQNLWQNYPIEGKRLGAEIRAVWLDRGTIVRARSEKGLAMVFDRLASAGINTVFFETLNAGYTVYPSNIAPAQNPLTVGWDPLASAVKLAKERNMELHAWIWVFATGNKHHNVVTKQPEDYLGPVLTAHPTWANLDNQARIRHVNDGKVYLDPANPQVRNYLLKIIDEITTRYQVDGLQLDYIRYPFQDANRNFTFGYGIAARQQFHQQFGVDPIKLTPKDQLWAKWTEFKTNQVTSFVGEVSQLIKRKHPNVILSAAVFPHPRYERLGKIQQDWEAWTKAGYIDLLTPMTYALDTNRLNELTTPLPNSLGQSLLAPAVKLLNIPEIVAIDQIQALRDLPTTGYSLFAAERITSGIHNFLARTQGDNTGNNTRQASLNTLMGNSQTVSGTIPYRQPFTAAQERFNAIQQEWLYLISRQQLWLEKNDLEKIRSNSDRLATVLEKLATKPNTSDLTEAKKLLSELRSQFNRYTGKSQLPEHSYQANSWKNRLEAVERILIYGENLK
ncbi:MAG: family 10 glycosylhydrolase, partial [Microcoleaceae cyanobacterium]